MAEEKFYGMKNDYMFKAVLQSSEEVLRNLVAVMLEIDEEDIQSCKLENTIELGKSVDAKDCVLDVKLTLNSNEVVDLEMQVRDEGNWPERSLLYWSRAYDKLQHGQDYLGLKMTYHIGILDFTLFRDNPSFYAEYMVRDTHTGYTYSDKLNIRILDLTRVAEAEDELIIMEAEKQRRIVDGEKDDSFIRSIEMRRKLIKWARIFKAKTLSELEAIAGDEEVLKSMVTYIRELSEDEKIRQQCQAREDYERRLIGEYNRGNREGRQEGAKNMLIDLVKSGDISIEMAADKLGMSSGEFAKLI